MGLLSHLTEVSVPQDNLPSKKTIPSKNHESKLFRKINTVKSLVLGQVGLSEQYIPGRSNPSAFFGPTVMILSFWTDRILISVDLIRLLLYHANSVDPDQTAPRGP